MVGYDIIVKLSDNKEYLRVLDEDGDTYTFVDNIKDASLFTYDTSESLHYYLKMVRKECPSDRFCSAEVKESVLNLPLQNIIQYNKPHLV